MIVFARTPVAGTVKTRLTPPCSPAQAALLAALMIRHTVRLVVDHWPGPVRLAAWPSRHHPVFRDIERKFGIDVQRQAAGHLGDKMHQALRALTTRGIPAAVLGTDVPHCPPAILKRAYRLLQEGDEVIGPAHDGGYYLIGLQQPRPELFRDIPWGTDQVCAATHACAAACGLTLHSLDTLFDIDTWSDLGRVAEVFPVAKQWRQQLADNLPPE